MLAEFPRRHLPEITCRYLHVRSEVIRVDSTLSSKHLRGIGVAKLMWDDAEERPSEWQT